jgi:four helix bundle protein
MRGGELGRMQDFKKIRVWHAARSLARDVYWACPPKQFSRYPGLRSQTLRTANSIGANIAEGAAKTGREFARFLDMSLGAANELESHLSLAVDAGLISAREFICLSDKVNLTRRMIIRFAQKVREQHD